MGKNEDLIKKFSKLINNIVPQVLDFAKAYQLGRGTFDVPIGTFDFTEGWFRNSGIYTLTQYSNSKFELCIDFQADLLHWFCIEKKCKTKNDDIKNQVAILTIINQQLNTADNRLLPECFEITTEGKTPKFKNKLMLGLYEKILEEAYISKSGGIKSAEERFSRAIEAVNKEVENKALFGVDCLDELSSMIDETDESKQIKINCVVTDPPWGVSYIPSRDTGNPTFDGDLDSTISFLDEVFSKVKQVCVEDAHLYVFFPTVFQNVFYNLLSKHFDVDPIPLVWVKNNHTPCDFKNRHASKYENIFFCKMPGEINRELNKGVTPDVFNYAKPTNKWHDCQKPTSLLSEFIENSTTENEIVLDPFAGSGSTLLSAKISNRKYIGFEKEKKYENDFTEALRKLEGVSK